MDLPIFFGVPSLLDRLMEQDGKTAFPVLQELYSHHFPPLQVFEDDACLYVRACIPGVALEGVSLTLSGASLWIGGVIPWPEGRCLRQERVCGPFKREVRLPCAVEGEDARAAMRDGLLTVTLPKSARAGRRVIPVAAEKEAAP